MLRQQKIEQLAALSVARGCGVAALGIAAVMVALAGSAVGALKIGGILALATCLVLLYKAAEAKQRSYRDTEVWTMLDPSERPGETDAQTLISGALSHIYLRFAHQFALGSIVLLSGALLAGLAGGSNEPG